VTLIFTLYIKILSACDFCDVDVYGLSILICITDTLFVHARIRIAVYSRHRSTRVTSVKGKTRKVVHVRKLSKCMYV